MSKTAVNNADKTEKDTILQELELTDETISSILIFIPALIFTLMSSLATKRILVGRLNDIKIQASPTPVELSIAADKLIVIGLVVAGDVAYKRFVQKSHQNLTEEGIEPYRIFLFAAIIRVIASFLSLFATEEVARNSEIKIVQQL